MRAATSLGLALGLVVLGSTVLAPGCGGSENGTTSASGGGNGAGSSVGGAGTGGNLFSGAGGDNGTGGANNCAQTDEEATLTNRPVDIIIVIDNSGSMSAEIQEVEEQINANFATILNGANPPIDYRVIMVSAYGSYNDRRICVAAPLGGIPDNDMDGHCDSIPSQPVNTANFFHHSSTISSHNALCKLLSDYNTADQFNLQPTGYNEVLRDDSFKFFLVITDDGVSCDSFNDGNSVAGGDTVATAWDTAVLALSAQHFGTAMARNYAFWSIIAQEPYMTSGMKPYGEPSPPDAMLAPITTGECTPSAVDPGTGYQGLSILSGGYRYPTCGLDYTDIFVKMAEGVIAGAQVPCAFEIPEPPPGETLDLATVQVKYSSGGAEVATFSQVGSPAECDANSFYIDSMANEIVLCPDACAIVQADEEAKINIAYGCELGVQ